MQCKLYQKLAYHKSTTTLHSHFRGSTLQKERTCPLIITRQSSLLIDAKQTIALISKSIAKTCFTVPLRKNITTKLKKLYDDNANELHSQLMSTENWCLTTKSCTALTTELKLVVTYACVYVQLCICVHIKGERCFSNNSQIVPSNYQQFFWPKMPILSIQRRLHCAETNMFCLLSANNTVQANNALNIHAEEQIRKKAQESRTPRFFYKDSLSIF